ncbi:hypothetical protein [Evansella tamaricis]|uniref:Lipocalin-like domain-containing protein n=1 Tax=Evansella tamaricis TaxID=2069301 RepID=A0ABS6JNZ4_9BACI|nr:hypothetical protein [Evansella tamaricis]MBU9714924.1 hypothetical protein [Evansella tamaricis]
MKSLRVFWLVLVALAGILGCEDGAELEKEFSLAGDWDVKSVVEDGRELIVTSLGIVPLTFTFDDDGDEGFVKNVMGEDEDTFTVFIIEEGRARLEFKELEGEYLEISFENGEMTITSPEEFPDTERTYMKAVRK